MESATSRSRSMCWKVSPGETETSLMKVGGAGDGTWVAVATRRYIEIPHPLHKG